MVEEVREWAGEGEGEELRLAVDEAPPLRHRLLFALPCDLLFVLLLQLLLLIVFAFLLFLIHFQMMMPATNAHLRHIESLRSTLRTGAHKTVRESAIHSLLMSRCSGGVWLFTDWHNIQNLLRSRSSNIRPPPSIMIFAMRNKR